MTVYSMTLDLPGALYHRLKRRAERAQRTVKSELMDMIVMALPVSDELPADLAEALSSLAALDDDALWRAAHSHLSGKAAAQLEGLNLKDQREGLIERESRVRDKLIRQYERAMLVRAQAAVLLKQRGYDVSVLIK